MNPHRISSPEALPVDADPFSLVREDLDQVEKLLDERVTSEVGLILEVGRYIMDAGGKRFRPALHLLASKLLGYEGEWRLWVAGALECIHTATLLHDDVVDSASIRRGRPAANTVFGDHTAVLVGDFLFATSVKWVLNADNRYLHRKFVDVCAGMAEGEAYQIAVARKRRLREDDYLMVVKLKTAGLISMACSSAAMLAGEDKKVEEALADFGHSVGMAFQIVDDALDYTSEENELGKAIGKDLEEGKITLPMLHALKKADKKDRAAIETILDSRDLKPEDLVRAQEIIKRYGGIEYALERAWREIDEGKKALTVFPPSPIRDALLEMAEFTVARSR